MSDIDHHNSTSILRIGQDRPDLGFLTGDRITVQGTTTADTGQIVITLSPDREALLGRHDGTGQVIGLVTEMHRRVPGAQA